MAVTDQRCKVDDRRLDAAGSRDELAVLLLIATVLRHHNCRAERTDCGVGCIELAFESGTAHEVGDAQLAPPAVALLHLDGGNLLADLLLTADDDDRAVATCTRREHVA